MICFQHDLKLRYLCVDSSCHSSSASACEQCLRDYHNNHSTTSANKFEADLRGFLKKMNIFQTVIMDQLQKYRKQRLVEFQEQIMKIIDQFFDALHTQFSRTSNQTASQFKIPFSNDDRILMANILSQKGAGQATGAEVSHFVQQFLDEPEELFQKIKQKQNDRVDYSFQRALSSLRNLLTVELRLTFDLKSGHENKQNRRSLSASKDNNNNDTIILHQHPRQKIHSLKRTEIGKFRTTSEESNHTIKSFYASKQNPEGSLWTKNRKLSNHRSQDRMTPPRSSSGFLGLISACSSGSFSQYLKQCNKRKSVKEQIKKQETSEAREKENQRAERRGKVNGQLMEKLRKERNVLGFIESRIKQRKAAGSHIQELKAQIQCEVDSKLQQTLEQIQKLVKDQQTICSHTNEVILTPSFNNLMLETPPRKTNPSQNQIRLPIQSCKNAEDIPRVAVCALRPVHFDEENYYSQIQHFKSRIQDPQAQPIAKTRPIITQVKSEILQQQKPLIPTVHILQQSPKDLPVANANTRVKQSSISKLSSPKPEQTVLQNNQSKVIKKTKKELTDKQPKFKISQNEIQSIELDSKPVAFANTPVTEEKIDKSTLLNNSSTPYNPSNPPTSTPAMMTGEELTARLNLIPKVSKFLQENMQEMEEAWRKSDNMCWHKFFELRLIHGIDDGGFLTTRVRIKQSKIQFVREDIISAMEDYAQKIKITSVAKKKNYKILKYMVLHVAEIIILLEGNRVSRAASRYSASELNKVLDRMQAGDATAANEYIKQKVPQLRQIS